MEGSLGLLLSPWPPEATFYKDHLLVYHLFLVHHHLKQGQHFIQIIQSILHVHNHSQKFKLEQQVTLATRGNILYRSPSCLSFISCSSTVIQNRAEVEHPSVAHGRPTKQWSPCSQGHRLSLRPGELQQMLRNRKRQTQESVHFRQPMG